MKQSNLLDTKQCHIFISKLYKWVLKNCDNAVSIVFGKSFHQHSVVYNS